MIIQELEQTLEFMASVGYTNREGGILLSKYFNARANGYTAEQASTLIFTEYESGSNRELTLTKKIKAFHKKLCKVDGYDPEMVTAAVENFYNL